MVLFEGKNMGLATIPLFIVQGAILPIGKGKWKQRGYCMSQEQVFYIWAKSEIGSEESTFHNQIKSKLNTISTLEPHTEDYMMSQEYFDHYF